MCSKNSDILQNKSNIFGVTLDKSVLPWKTVIFNLKHPKVTLFPHSSVFFADSDSMNACSCARADSLKVFECRTWIVQPHCATRDLANQFVSVILFPQIWKVFPAGRPWMNCFNRTKMVRSTLFGCVTGSGCHFFVFRLKLVFGCAIPRNFCGSLTF